MRNIVIICTLALLAGCTNDAVLTVKERASLGAFLSYEIVTLEAVVPDKPDGKPGDICPECGGRGKQGDGTIEYECNACNGTGRIPDTGSDSEDLQDEIDNIELVNVENESEVKEPLITAQVVKTKPVYRMSSVRWSVNKKHKYTTKELSNHLMSEHNIITDGYSREEMQAMHDNIHNGYAAHGSKK